jgi:hypothetical protein
MLVCAYSVALKESRQSVPNNIFNRLVALVFMMTPLDWDGK